MKIRFAVPLAVALFMTLPAFAQRGEEHHDNVHANQGHIPQAAPPHRDAHAEPEVERHEGGRVNSVPHVSNDHWYGHDAPNDKRYVIAHPYEHGRFEHFGSSYR
jgi:hypothetical protein